ncbi:hypothetical protein BDF20DRAFT_893222 [Mycotypha africana]|uniref:uncharacterized protein n=1 Tax=Mycotypha africana TaxID=64632 RepID=UPI0023007CCC|nr:uncharacterized protein BDF20DRAFT_893222 [Mycotypha africana]KAI8969093.1 hypothetical protein BDF20DRAFT_893222 [Mycotypha africana]
MFPDKALFLGSVKTDRIAMTDHQVMEGSDNDKENLKRGDFYTDSKLKDILNHAYFVPLPDSITQEESTGIFRQRIVPFNAPLWFVQKKRALNDEQIDSNKVEGNAISNSNVTTFYAETPRRTTVNDAEVDNDIDVELDDGITSLNDESNANVGEESVKPAIKEEESIQLILKDEDEPLLDIEGDDDVMDHVQPWKIRLMEQPKRTMTASRENPPEPIAACFVPNNITKQNTNEVISLNQFQTSPQRSVISSDGDASRPKKKKKTVSFAF